MQLQADSDAGRLGHAAPRAIAGDRRIHVEQILVAGIVAGPGKAIERVKRTAKRAKANG